MVIVADLDKVTRLNKEALGFDVQPCMPLDPDGELAAFDRVAEGREIPVHDGADSRGQRWRVGYLELGGVDQKSLDANIEHGVGKSVLRLHASKDIDAMIAALRTSGAMVASSKRRSQ